MVKKALIVGSADPVWGEVDAALKLFDPDLVFAVNEAFVDYPGHVHHFVSFHSETLCYWLQKRGRYKRSPPDFIWAHDKRKLPKNIPTDIPLLRAPNWRGSSGLLAVAAALNQGCEKLVLCGIHLDKEASHFHSKKRTPWRDAHRYRKGWIDHRDLYASKTRSMGGWTRNLLGAPTEHWLNGKNNQEAGCDA